MRLVRLNENQGLSNLEITRQFPLQAQTFSGNYDISEVNKVKNKLKRNINSKYTSDGGYFRDCAIMVNPDDTVLVGFSIYHNGTITYWECTFKKLEEVDKFAKMKSYLKTPLDKLDFNEVDKRKFFTDYYSLKGQKTPEVSDRTKPEVEETVRYNFWMNVAGGAYSRDPDFVVYGADVAGHYKFKPKQIAYKVSEREFREFIAPGNGSRIASYKTLCKKLATYGLKNPPTEEELIDACQDDRYFIYRGQKQNW